MGKREREDKSAASSNAVASAKPRRGSVGSSQNASSSKLLSGNSAAKPSVSASASKSSAASSASAKPSAQMSFEDLLKDISSSSDTALVNKASAVTSERKKDTEQQKTKQNSHANTPAASAAAAGAGKAKAQAPSAAAGASAAPAKLAPKQKAGKSKAPVFKGGFDSDEEGGGDDAAVESSDDAEDDEEDDEEVDADGDDNDEGGSDDEEQEEEDEEDDDAALLDESTGGLSINQHKKQLEKLKESDPKFYAYLQKTSANLLSFGEGEADAEEGDEEEEEEEAGDDQEPGDDDEEDEGEPMEEGDGGRKRKGPHEQETLTAESAKSILAQAFEAKTWRGLVRACQAFRAACYSGDSADVLSRLGLASSGGSGYGKSKKNKDRSGGNEKGKAKVSAAEAAEGEMNKLKALRFRVNSSKVFMMVVQEVLTKAGAAFAHHMGAPRGQKQQQKQAEGAGAAGPADAAAEADDGIDINGINTRIPLSDYPGYTKVAQLAKGLLMCTVHLLSQTTEPSFITFTLRSLRSFIPYLQGQGALTKKVLRSLLSLFGSHENAGVRLQAYMRVRQAAVVLPYPTIDLCLKGCYMAFVRGAKFMTESGASNILLTANCVAELYGIDDTTSYQHAFIYLRQLAIHLRTALTTQSKEAAANVLSWSFVNCLRLWSSVLVRHGSDTSRPLFQLLYPLVQVINGVLRMQPSPRYYPMRLHLVSCLNDMAWASGVYIPTSPLLIDVLRSPSLSTKPKGAAPANPPLLSLMVKVGKTTLATRSYQDALASRTFELLLDSLKVNYCSVAFPELIVPVAGALRSFAKETRVGAWRSRAKALLDAINGQAAKIAQKRATLNAAPGDRASIAAFMQAEGAALRAERSKGREAAAKELVQQAQDAAVAAANAAANAEAASKKGSKQRQQKKRNAKDSDDDSDNESDDEEEDEEESDFDGSGAEDDEDEDGSEEEAEEEEAERPAKRAAAAAPAGTKKLAAAAAAAAASMSTKASAKGGKKAMLPVVAGDDVVEDFDLSDLE